MGEVDSLTQDLVSIPSHEDETEAGDAIEAWLRKETDAEISRDDAGNVFGRRNPGNKSIALVGHHDVVAPADSQVDSDGTYIVEKRDGRLYGRGTADMKGSVAAAMCAFRDAEPDCELVFASFVGEEIGGIGSRYAIDHGFAPDYAIVGEGSTNYSASGVTDVVFTHRGRQEHAITVHGSAAHASELDAGDNAVYRASEVVDTIQGIEYPSKNLHGHSFSGSAAVTGIEDGGSAANVIPEVCTLTVDERTVPGTVSALKTVEDISDVELSTDQNFPSMLCEDEDFANLVRDAADAVQDGTPELTTKPHATDAGWLSDAGTTCVVCGASEPGEAHTESESASTEVLDRTYRIYKETVDRL